MPLRLHLPARGLPLLALTGCLLLRSAATAPAQDFTLGPIEWADADDPPDTLPTTTSLKPPRVPAELRTFGQPAYGEVTLYLDEKGRSRFTGRWFSLPWINEWWDDRSARPAFEPARREGKAVPATVRLPIVFNPASAAAIPEVPDATPRLLRAVPPVLRYDKVPAPDDRPPAPRPTVLVEVTARVEADGTVSGVQVAAGTAAELARMAGTAVKQWGFAPARKGGVGVAADVPLSVRFRYEDSLSAAELTTRPKVKSQAPPVYPLGMRRAALQGEVLIGLVVGVEGRVTSAEVLRSTNPGFDSAAIEAVLKWRFEPGMKDGVPVKAHLAVPIMFRIEGGGWDPYSVKSSRKTQEKLPPELRYDTPPKVRSSSLAVYPFEQLRDRKDGKVKVVFAIDPRGEVRRVEVTQTPHPAFGEAVRAMLETFSFQPALRDGQPTWCMLAMEIDFDSDGRRDVPVPDSAGRLIRRHTDDPGSFPRLNQLDEPLRPTSRRPPIFPRSVAADVAEGSATIEFIIDRYGLAQIPRIVEASDTAFGYAAAQAVATWRFQPPQRGGRAVEVIARVPVIFKRPVDDPPAEAEPAAASAIAPEDVQPETEAETDGA